MGKYWSETTVHYGLYMCFHALPRERTLGKLPGEGPEEQSQAEERAPPGSLDFRAAPLCAQSSGRSGFRVEGLGVSGLGFRIQGLIFLLAASFGCSRLGGPGTFAEITAKP